MGGLSAFGGGLAGYIVPFLFVLTIVVFFHELGHFLVARWCGIKVLTFSIGFGPELAGFNDRYGTRWKISAIPLGGYVKFFGDDNAASAPDQEAIAGMTEAETQAAFASQPVGPRAAVVVAGPLANFVLAIVIFAAIFMTVGKQTTTARVDTVQPNSAAAAAGFQPGDLVLVDRRQQDRQLHRHAAHRQRQRRRDAHHRSRARRRAGDAAGHAAAASELKDNFGNVQRLGVLGISRSMAPGDIKTDKMGPLEGGRGSARRNLVRRSTARCLTSAGFSPAARRPTSSAGRSASPRFPARWPRPASSPSFT